MIVHTIAMPLSMIEHRLCLLQQCCVHNIPNEQVVVAFNINVAEKLAIEVAQRALNNWSTAWRGLHH